MYFQVYIVDINKIGKTINIWLEKNKNICV